MERLALAHITRFSLHWFLRIDVVAQSTPLVRRFLEVATLAAAGRFSLCAAFEADDLLSTLLLLDAATASGSSSGFKRLTLLMPVAS